jgi:3-oxoacyl-[acyl-carrier-protein] synthase III
LTNAKITALGCYVPPRILSNDDLSKMVETNDSWIVERTGIRERHIADPDVATSDMALLAAQKTLEARGVAPGELHAIIVCTVTPDMMFPSTACIVQQGLGASGSWGFDLVAACSGFVYGLTVASNLVRGTADRKVLVIGADTMSRIIDYTDRSTCVLFGDGAGAFLVEPSEDPNFGFVDYINEIDGSGGQFLYMPAGGSRRPASPETIAQGMHYVKQEGQQVFKYAVRKMYELSEAILRRNGLSAADVSLMIPHQANQRIIAATAERLGIPAERVVLNLSKLGNTTAATIPLATGEALSEGRLRKGDLVLFSAVGAGYTAGVSLWRWAY